MEGLTNKDAQKNMAFWHEMAVNEQKKGLREYKKKAKSQAVGVPLIIVEDLSSSA
jgi:hypothetical protein